MVAAVLVVTAVVAACTVPPRPAPFVGRAVTLPAVPVVAVAGVTIDPAGIDERACRRCEALGGVLGVEEFLYGDLAVAAFGVLGAVERADAATRARSLGDLVASGYHGGRWLAAELDTLGTAPVPDPGARDLALAIGNAIYAALGDLLRSTGSAATTADPSTAAGLGLLLSVAYGYNRGYLDLALERPPPGVIVDPAALSCPSALACASGRFPLGDLDRWGDVDALLATPPSQRWADAARVLDGLLAGAVSSGRAVWDRLLAGAGFSAGSYDALVDTSAGFLALTGVALRAALSAWAEGDRDDTRVAHDLATGLLAWAGSYFLGLAAPAGDPLPSLNCP